MPAISFELHIQLLGLKQTLLSVTSLQFYCGTSLSLQNWTGHRCKYHNYYRITYKQWLILHELHGSSLLHRLGTNWTLQESKGLLLILGSYFHTIDTNIKIIAMCYDESITYRMIKGWYAWRNQELCILDRWSWSRDIRNFAFGLLLKTRLLDSHTYHTRC
jgi:hypothetical protein